MITVRANPIKDRDGERVHVDHKPVAVLTLTADGPRSKIASFHNDATRETDDKLFWQLELRPAESQERRERGRITSW